MAESGQRTIERLKPSFSESNTSHHIKSDTSQKGQNAAKHERFKPPVARVKPMFQMSKKLQADQILPQPPYGQQGLNHGVPADKTTGMPGKPIPPAKPAYLYDVYVKPVGENSGEATNTEEPESQAEAETAQSMEKRDFVAPLVEGNNSHVPPNMIETEETPSHTYGNVSGNEGHSWRTPTTITSEEKPPHTYENVPGNKWQSWRIPSTNTSDSEDSLLDDDDYDYCHGVQCETDDDMLESGDELDEEPVMQEAQNVHTPPAEHYQGQIFFDKAHQIAHELYTSEQLYVTILYLLAKVVLSDLRKKNVVKNMFSEDVIDQMFPDIESIYILHQGTVLPRLAERLADWESTPRIGDVMIELAPYLKLYSEYLMNAEKALALVVRMRTRQADFDKLLKSIEERPEFANTTIQNYMLEPLYRVPRIKLLLERYARHLPEDSQDLQDTKDAIKLISEITSKHKEDIKVRDNSSALFALSNRLSDAIDLFDRPREFIKKGHLSKVSAHHGKKYKRVLLLFSDMLLVCKRTPLSKYEIKARLNLKDMEIPDPEYSPTDHGFIVKSTRRVIKFCCKTEDDEIRWRHALKDTIRSYQEKAAPTNRQESSDEKLVGEEAPAWVPGETVTKCMQCCDTVFSFLIRKHHCRACGDVVCGKCSMKQAPLQYKNNRSSRVCDRCFLDIQHKRSIAQSTRWSAPLKRQVSARDPAVLHDYILVSESRKSWQNQWLTFHPDQILHRFNTHTDTSAVSTSQVMGTHVSTVSDMDDAPCSFGLSIDLESGKNLHLKFQDETKFNRWLHVLRQASSGEPSETISTSSGSSTM